MNEIFINNQWIEVPEVKLKRQISEFGSLASKTNISNQFSIPKTKTNRNVFEWFDSIQSNSLVPYRELSSKLRVDGNIIIENGTAFIEKTSSDQIDIILRDGNIDFFKAIEGKTLRDMDLSDMDYVWHLDYARDERTATDKPVYLFHSFGLGYLDIAHMLPFIPINVLVDKIFEEAGYSKSGSIFTDVNYTDLWISLVDRLPDEDVSQELIQKAEDAITWTSVGLSKGCQFLTWEAPFNDFDLGGVLGYVTRYEVLYDGDYDFDISISFTTDYAISNLDQVWVYYGGTIDKIFASAGAGGKTIAQSYPSTALLTSDYIYVILKVHPTNTVDFLSGWIDITDAPTVEFGVYGATFNVSYNLPQMMQKDLLYLILNLFNARMDLKGSTVFFHKYVDLKTKIQQGDYIDWSEKDFTNIAVRYQSEYAKKNVIKYGNTELLQGSFEINDDQLKDFKTIYEIPTDNVESSKAFKSTEDSQSNVSYEFTHLQKPVIKTRDLQTGSARIFAASDFDDLTDNLPQVAGVNLQTYIDAYYDFFQKTLSMYREIHADVYLNINDINRLDFSKPYWIKKWGWFLLEQVSFRKGRKTTVKLIHINKSDYVPDLVGNDYNDQDYNTNDYLL